MKSVLGIDVGGTSIKGAVVDVSTGNLITDKVRLKTSAIPTPESITIQLADIVKRLNYNGESIGIGFPAFIEGKKSKTAANIDDSWIEFPLVDHLKNELGRDVYVVNDADAAALAEITHGGQIISKGLTIFLTIGTGVGSTFFYDGVLIPSTELGHIQYKDSIAEDYISNRARLELNLSWADWIKELKSFLKYLEVVFHPQQFVIGGGLSIKLEECRDELNLDTHWGTAQFFNNAGIIGAAMAADKRIIL